jgi:hypothetical protein
MFFDSYSIYLKTDKFRFVGLTHELKFEEDFLFTPI